MKKKRLFSVIALMLIMSMVVVTPSYAAKPKKTKTRTVYAVSSIKVNYNSKYNSKHAYKRTLKYNKNGLLKKMSSSADFNKFGASVCGKLEYIYKGKKLKKIRWRNYGPEAKDGRHYVTTFKYNKKGKLKSSKSAFTMKKNSDSSDDYIIYKHSLNKNGRITKAINASYKYDSKGHVIGRRSNKFYNDEHGYPVKCNFVFGTLHYDPSLPYRNGDRVENTAVNTYKNGRLAMTKITTFEGSKETVTVKYKKIRIPSNYYSTFKAQQYDIIFNFVYLGFDNSIGDPAETPIGFGKVK